MTLEEYRTTVRRMTRYAPLSDGDIDKEINNVKDTLFAIAPFYIKLTYHDTEAYKDNYSFDPQEPISQIIAVNYYPYLTTVSTDAVDTDDTEISVETTTGFTDNGFLVLEKDYRTEIVRYETKEGGQAPKFKSLTRGQFSSVAQAFDIGTYVRQWKSGYKWENVEALTEISLFEDERKLPNVSVLTGADATKRYYTYTGQEIFISPPPKLSSKGALRVAAFHRPPDLVSPSDTIKGFPLEMDRLVVLYACRNYWTYFGGEDSFRRLQATEAEFALLLNQFKERVDFAMKKILTFVMPEIGRRKE